MKTNYSLQLSNSTLRTARALAVTVFAGLVAVSAQGQIITRYGDGVRAYFASQSDFFQDSDPTGATFGPAGLGPYTAGVVLPGLPAAPTASLTPAGGNAFAGGGWTSVFNDLLPITTYSAAQSTIDDLLNTSPTITSDISIAIPAWRLFQAAGASGYAYEQINFGSNYLFTSNPGLAAAPSPNLPIFINGSVVTGGSAYIQFDGVIDYTWIPVTINTTGTITAGSPISLGQLTYTFNQTGGGPFVQTLVSGGSLLATPFGDGVLALDGHMWIAGDPFEINVTTVVPEPASAVLLALGTLILGARRKRLSLAD